MTTQKATQPTTKFVMPQAGEKATASNGDVYEVTKYIIAGKIVSVSITPAASDVATLSKKISYDQWIALKADGTIPTDEQPVTPKAAKADVKSQKGDQKSQEGDLKSPESSAQGDVTSQSGELKTAKGEVNSGKSSTSADSEKKQYEVGTKYTDLRNEKYTISEITDSEVIAKSFKKGPDQKLKIEDFEELVANRYIVFVESF